MLTIIHPAIICSGPENMLSNSFLQELGSSIMLLSFGGHELTCEGFTGSHRGVTGKSQQKGGTSSKGLNLSSAQRVFIMCLSIFHKTANYVKMSPQFCVPNLCFLMMPGRGMAAVSSSFSKLVLRGLFTLSLWL